VKAPAHFRAFLEEAVEYVRLRAEYRAKIEASDNPDAGYFLWRDERAASAAADRAWDHFNRALHHESERVSPTASEQGE
jgi:hypothetical protein